MIVDYARSNEEFVEEVELDEFEFLESQEEIEGRVRWLLEVI